MLTIFMMAIPCIGIFYLIFGAIFSSNDSRRNFYRAHLAWFAVVLVVYLSLFGIGLAPDLRKLYDQYRHDHSPEKSHPQQASQIN